MFAKSSWIYLLLWNAVLCAAKAVFYVLDADISASPLPPVGRLAPQRLGSGFADILA
jgi:hypothetical protein